MEQMWNDTLLTPTARFLLSSMILYNEKNEYDEYYVLKNYPNIERSEMMEGYEVLVRQGYLKRIIEKHTTHFYLDLSGEMDLTIFN